MKTRQSLPKQQYRQFQLRKRLRKRSGGIILTILLTLALVFFFIRFI